MAGREATQSDNSGILRILEARRGAPLRDMRDAIRGRWTTSTPMPKTPIRENRVAVFKFNDSRARHRFIRGEQSHIPARGFIP